MKRLKRIAVIILLVITICLVGYTCHTCSRTTENFTEQQLDIGGEEFG